MSTTRAVLCCAVRGSQRVDFGGVLETVAGFFERGRYDELKRSRPVVGGAPFDLIASDAWHPREE